LWVAHVVVSDQALHCRHQVYLAVTKNPMRFIFCEDEGRGDQRAAAQIRHDLQGFASYINKALTYK